MGQLTNLYVSQSYQGLLKMTNSTTGVTGTLQTVQTGDGTNTPLQISQTAVNISGSLTVNGSPISVDTGSLVTTASFNAYTSSVNTHLAGLDVETGSLQNQINGLATTGSLSGYTTVTTFNNYTGSNDAKVNDLISHTGSYATTGSNTFTGTQTIESGNSLKTNLINNVNSGQQITIDPDGDNNLYIKLDGFDDGGERLSISNQYNGSAGIYYYLEGGNSFRMYQNLFKFPDNTWQSTAYPGSSLTSSLVIDVTSGLTANDIVVTKGDGTTNTITIDNVTNATSASFAQNALSASYAPDNSNRNGLITTGSLGGSQSITGSLNVQGTISATSASFTYVTTTYETASVIYSSGSNQLGDASNDTQTLYGTVKLPNGPLDITGSIIVKGNQTIYDNGTGARLAVQGDIEANYITASVGFIGNLEGTASFATNALSSSFATNALSASYAPDNSNRNGLINTGSIAATQAITGSLISSGSLTITGSVNISTGTTTAGGINLGGSSANKLFVSGANNDVYLRGTNDIFISPGAENRLRFISTGGNSISSSLFGNLEITGSQSIKSGSISLISNGTTVSINNYLTSSDPSQANIIKGWGDNPASAGAGATQANYTGSLRITGSNNTVSIPQLRATSVGGGTDQQGYISGSDNSIFANNSGIYLNTGSLLFPKTQTNILGNGSSILMNFTTSSLAGGHPLVQNNVIFGGNLSINSNSGSVQTVGQNFILGGQIGSTQNFVTNVRPTITGNNVIGNITLNHISSSINYQQNYNNAPVTITNALSSSIAQNQLGILNNIFLGGSIANGHNIYVSGSQSTNVTRYIADNLIGGRNNVVSSSFVSSSNSNLFSSIVYGNGLVVSGSHSGNGGSAFVGRFNDTGSLHLAQDIVFAVGTGTAASLRRTGLYVTSGSLVGVSGSLNVIGNASITGDTIMSSSSTVPLIVSGTINTQRVHFNTNPFNSNPSSNLGAIRMAADNQTFQYTNYDLAQTTTQSFIDQYVNTGSLNTYTRFGAAYNGTSVQVTANNNNGIRNVDIKSDTTTITGSLAVTGDIQFASGSNKTMGTVVLDGGNPSTATVSNSLVTANTLIYLTKQTLTNAHMPAITSKGSGTFTITSTGNGDTDTVAYLIINPS